MSSSETRDDTIVEEITIRASAERIFEALTDPQQRIKWWGDQSSYRATHMESDLRPGGKWSTRGTGFGKPFTVRGEYRVVERPRVLAFTWIPDWQQHAAESLVRFDLIEKDGVTTVRLTHSGLTPEGRQAHRGWARMLGWLRAFVEPG
jgi:uncharacterized protein YndB with AHSA1/START domain